MLWQTRKILWIDHWPGSQLIDCNCPSFNCITWHSWMRDERNRSIATEWHDMVQRKEGQSIINMCHSEKLPFTAPPISKGPENWPPESVIFASTMLKLHNPLYGSHFCVTLHSLHTWYTPFYAGHVYTVGPCSAVGTGTGGSCPIPRICQIS